MLEAPASDPLDPYELELTQYLTNRLPGYMVRSLPGRLWARIGRREAGRRPGPALGLFDLGKALIAAYQLDFPTITGVEIALVTSNESDLETLAPLCLEADVIAGRHKRLSLGVSGDLDCSELDCENCDEKPVCDNLREVVRIRRRSRR